MIRGKLGLAPGPIYSNLVALSAALLGAELPPNLWYEGGVVWALPNPGAQTGVGIAFDNATAFQQYVSANLPYGASQLAFMLGSGPYGSGFQFAQFTAQEGIYYKLAMTATSGPYLRSILMQRNLLRGTPFANSVGPCFPLTALSNIQVNSPKGMVTDQPLLVSVCLTPGSLDSQQYILY